MSCTTSQAQPTCVEQGSTGCPASAIPPELKQFAEFVASCRDMDDLHQKIADAASVKFESLRDVLIEGLDSQRWSEATLEQYDAELDCVRYAVLSDICALMGIEKDWLLSSNPNYLTWKACYDGMCSIGHRNTPLELADAITDRLCSYSLQVVADLLSEDGWGGLPPLEIERRDLEKRLEQGREVDTTRVMAFPDLVQRFGI